MNSHDDEKPAILSVAELSSFLMVSRKIFFYASTNFLNIISIDNSPDPIFIRVTLKSNFKIMGDFGVRLTELIGGHSF